MRLDGEAVGVREAKNSGSAIVADLSEVLAGAEGVEQGLEEAEETDDDGFDEDDFAEVAREFFGFEVDLETDNRDEETGEDGESGEGAGFIGGD